MSISDGQKVDATNSNAAWMSRTSNTDTIGEVDLLNASYTNLISLQRIITEALSALGVSNEAATDSNANTYSSNTTGINTLDRKAAIGVLDALFNGASGHTHDGTDGQGAQIDANDLDNFNNLFTEFGEDTYSSASGTSIDVSTEFSGKSSGGDANTEGVLTTAPTNYIQLIESTTGQEIEDSEGLRVYGRLTESAGTWTLSFYVNDAGVETAHNLSSQDINFLYREVFDAANRPTIGANVATYDSLQVIADIPDASASQRGAVSTGAQTFAGVKEFASRPTTNSIDIADISSSQVFTEKDYDGGTASNTSRLTLPSNTKANLDALTRKKATFVYATDEDKVYADDGSTLVEIGSGGGGGAGGDWQRKVLSAQARDELTGYLDQDDSNFRWNNLTNGQTYRVSGQFFISDSTFAPNSFEVDIDIENDGTVIGNTYFRGELSNDATGNVTLSYSVIFEASGVNSSVRFNVVTNTLGRVLATQTYTFIEELDNATEVTTWT